jgi:hypothetical protein
MKQGVLTYRLVIIWINASVFSGFILCFNQSFVRKIEWDQGSHPTFGEVVFSFLHPFPPGPPSVSSLSPKQSGCAKVVKLTSFFSFHKVRKLRNINVVGHIWS